jgi:hypothetical protein
MSSRFTVSQFHSFAKMEKNADLGEEGAKRQRGSKETRCTLLCVGRTGRTGFGGVLPVGAGVAWQVDEQVSDDLGEGDSTFGGPDSRAYVDLLGNGYGDVPGH